MVYFCLSLQIFFHFSYISATVTAYCISFFDRIYCCFFCFLSNQENLYMIHHDLNLFYEISNKINKHNQRQTHYLLLIITSSAPSLIEISMLSFFECTTRPSSLSSSEEKKNFYC